MSLEKVTFALEKCLLEVSPNCETFLSAICFALVIILNLKATLRLP